eukprot:574835-Rhodomonas_salina.3
MTLRPDPLADPLADGLFVFDTKSTEERDEGSGKESERESERAKEQREREPQKQTWTNRIENRGIPCSISRLGEEGRDTAEGRDTDVDRLETH